jgi:hypothetical protein
MAKVSIVVPSRNERFLPETVRDLLAKAVGVVYLITNQVTGKQRRANGTWVAQ